LQFGALAAIEGGFGFGVAGAEFDDAVARKVGPDEFVEFIPTAECGNSEIPIRSIEILSCTWRQLRLITESTE
jgi:hypothetical protein